MYSIILFCTLFYNVISDSRILNGKATEDPIPYHVSIQVNKNFHTECDDFEDFTSNFHFFGFGSSIQYSQAINHHHYCGGTILTKDYILTAAHCVYFFSNVPSEVSVAVGIYKQSEIRNFQRYCVKEIRTHEEYYKINNKSDIAILKLTRSIDLSKPANARAIPLSKSFIGVGHQLYVTGWGYINAKKTIFADELQELFIRTQHCNEGPKILCGRPINGALCQADSGSPVTYMNQTELVGVVLRANCVANTMFYLLRISEFYDWILIHTEQVKPIHVHDGLRSLN